MKLQAINNMVKKQWWDIILELNGCTVWPTYGT